MKRSTLKNQKQRPTNTDNKKGQSSDTKFKSNGSQNNVRQYSSHIGAYDDTYRIRKSQNSCANKSDNDKRHNSTALQNRSSKNSSKYGLYFGTSKSSQDSFKCFCSKAFYGIFKKMKSKKEESKSSHKSSNLSSWNHTINSTIKRTQDNYTQNVKKSKKRRKKFQRTLTSLLSSRLDKFCPLKNGRISVYF